MQVAGIPKLPERFVLTESSGGDKIVAELFQRKFGDPPPGDPIHTLLLYHTDSGAWVPVSYLHWQAVGRTCLVGGGLTDGRAFRQIDASDAEALTAAGGGLFALLRYGFVNFADRFDVFFGHCGDPRAEEVDLAAGFEKTDHEHLLIYKPQALHPNIEQAMIAMAVALGPF